MRNFMVEFQWRMDGLYPRGLFVPCLCREYCDLPPPQSNSPLTFITVFNSPYYSLSFFCSLCLSLFIYFYPFTCFFYFISVCQKSLNPVANSPFVMQPMKKNDDTFLLLMDFVMNVQVEFCCHLVTVCSNLVLIFVILLVFSFIFQFRF